jgi:hypothetical protein
MKQAFIRVSIILAFLASLAATSRGQSGGAYSSSWNTIDGGGGPVSGGSYSLNGTIGQPDLGAMSGGAFTVSAGFWPGIGTPPPGPAPGLSIRLGPTAAGVKTVILSWPNPSTGYVLQQTSNMNAPGGGWMDVTQPLVVNSSNKEVTLTATGQFCLFRLRKM